MTIQVTDSFNQLKIVSGNIVQYYKYATVKSLSPVSDSKGDFAVIINFIVDDKNNPLVLKMKDISNQGTWINTAVGVNIAIEAISDWMHTDNPSTDVTITGWTSPLGQDLMAASIPVVIASDQSSVSTAIAYPLGNFASTQAVTVTIARDEVGNEKRALIARPSSSDASAFGIFNTNLNSLSIANVGTATATIQNTSLGATDGVELKIGETISFDAGAINATLDEVNYDVSASGAELLIIWTQQI